MTASDIRGRLLFILMLLATTVLGQTGNLVIEYKPNRFYGKDLDSMQAIIFIRKALKADDTNAFNRDERMAKHQQKIEISGLPIDTFFVSIIPFVDKVRYGTSIRKYYPDTLFRNVVVKANLATHLMIVFPSECVYYKHSHNKTCPKCKKSDKVLRIAYGLPLADPHSPGDSEPSWPGTCDVTGCDPTWHCTRDNTEF